MSSGHNFHVSVLPLCPIASHQRDITEGTLGKTYAHLALSELWLRHLLPEMQPQAGMRLSQTGCCLSVCWSTYTDRRGSGRLEEGTCSALSPSTETRPSVPCL